MIEILPDDNDDLGFTGMVEKILNGFVQDFSPKEIYVIKIDSWFDFKWRAFEGKLVGAVGS